ncbi:unnamed protein product [Leptosia nina]|uniref:Uncharacterized protein n=1 Tax=Leptosia nina TaxID=320188 RepID=A0AAV1IV09_9NEOP
MIYGHRELVQEFSLAHVKGGRGLSPAGRFPFHAPLNTDDTAFLRPNGSTNEQRALQDPPRHVITVTRAVETCAKWYELNDTFGWTLEGRMYEGALEMILTVRCQ